MAACPSCGVSYGDGVTRCPKDGTLLPETGPTLAARRRLAPQPPDAPLEPTSSTRRVSYTFSSETLSQVAIDEDLPPGTAVGEYQVTAKSNVDETGTLYAGVHPIIEKKVSVKILRRELSEDRAAMQRFLAHLRKVTQIAQVNVASILAFGQLPDGRMYLVTEFLVGETLAAWRATRALPVAQGLPLAVQLGRGLAAAHALGLAHADVRPENVFLVDGARQVKLLGFGVGELGAGALRSPFYLSPEQCRGEPASLASDVYALGVVLYELFSGQLPFYEGSYREIAEQHLSAPPPRAAGPPDELAQLIERCLRKDARERPASAVDVVAVLAQLARTAPVAEAPAPTEKRAPVAELPTERSRRSVGRLLVPGALLAALVAVALLVARPKRAEPLIVQVVSVPAGATVSINGLRQVLLTPYAYSIARAPRLQVKVELEGFRPAERVLDVRADENATAVRVALESLAPPSGSLEVQTPVRRAAWTVDGAPAGDGSGVLTVAGLAVGAHRVRLVADGYVPREEAVEVGGSTRTVLRWTLESASRDRRRDNKAKRSTPSHAPDLDSMVLSD
jgi:serine/threonine-protein kinase